MTIFGLRNPVFTAIWTSICLLLTQELNAQNNRQSDTNDPATLQRKEFSQADFDFFEKKIRPLLEKHCLDCHGKDEKKIRGGLRLTSRKSMLIGGDSGPAIVPGHADKSLLIEAIHYDSYEMPPSGKLADHAIEAFETWIEMGAPDPRATARISITKAIDIEEGRKFWSFQPIVAQDPPTQLRKKDWPSNEIDQFVLSRMEAANLQPEKDAGRSTLLRRLSIALTGLPPDENEIRKFTNSPAPLEEDLTSVVDQLLESRAFGERWGRHWLDVARFAESSGGGRSLMFPDAWRYRDYVIDSFEADKPIDQFLIEQLAGDLLPYDSQEQRNEQVVATGLLALGPSNYELQDKELLRMEVIDEQIDTVGRAMLGLTLGCARCHDHKFDPIPISDYYALAGIFKSTKSLVPGNVSGHFKTPLVSAEKVQAWRSYQNELKKLNQQINQTRKKHAQEKNESKKSGQANNAWESQLKQLKKQLAELKKRAPSPIPYAMSVSEHSKITDSPIHIRGEIRNLGKVVPRGFVTVASCEPATESITPEQSGRLQLARWIASDQNPLTARVYVNRVWQHLIGQGLVATPDNFGRMGSKPSHPALLDYLANEFIKNGWSTKKLVRKIVLSRTFRMKTAIASKDDPENRLLTRAHRRRVDAEVIRDSILSISGQLDSRAGGLTIRKISQYDLGYQFNTNRRSVYVPAFRNSMLDLFEIFDMANPNLVSGKRNVSTLPTQALYMMNSRFVIEQAQHAAQRLISETSGRDERIEVAYLRTLGRHPSAKERELAIEFILRSEQNSQSPQDRKNDELKCWSGLFHSLIASVEFRYLN